jgi:hypothetical protein
VGDCRPDGYGRTVARKNNRRDDVAPLDPERVRQGAAWLVTGPDGAWFVRSVTAAGAVKLYRCPGCDHEITPGMPHVVVWPADDVSHQPYGHGRIADRRHWHTACWGARARRRL